MIEPIHDVDKEVNKKMEKVIFTIKEVEIALINLRRTGSTSRGLLGHEAMQVLRKIYKEMKETGDGIKCYGDFESCNQMTVGELKKRLNEYEDDTPIYMEASNKHNRGDTAWSQRLLDTYSCKEVGSNKTGKKALMLVGNLR